MLALWVIQRANLWTFKLKKGDKMKKAASMMLASLFGLGLTTLALLWGGAASVQAVSGIFYVAPGGACGGGVSPCYASIQTAVDAAAPGDEIRVAAGTYSDVHVRPRHDTSSTGVVTQTVYLTKTLAIRGGYNSDFSTQDPDTYPTILDAQGQGRGIYIVGNISPTIQGLGVTGGDATGMGGYDYYGSHDAGGGVYIITATATLIDDQVYNNTSSYGGGGVYLGYTSASLKSNQIFDNHVPSSGGGVFIYKGSPTLYGNEVISNTTNNLGGGLYLFSTSATLHRNIIRANSAQSIGGGLDVASCSPILTGNLFSGNKANRGGGAYFWYSHSILTNNVFIDNQAPSQGSGLWLGGSQPVLLHTTFASNTGGGGEGIVATDAGVTPSTLDITNTIIADQSVGISLTVGSSAAIDGILWYNTPITATLSGVTVTIQHQYQGDPAFAPDGYHLTAGSAAIGKGVPAGVNTDIDNQPRPSIGPDLGADQYWPPGSPHYIFLPYLHTVAPSN